MTEEAWAKDAFHKIRAAAAEPSFTPGPWQRKNDYDGRYTIIGNVDGDTDPGGSTIYSYDFIANCEDDYGEPASPANVRLILAAPDLYKALSAAAGYLRNAQIDLETGAPKATALRTIKGGLKLVEDALAGVRS
jgi:hypothetical protein